MDDRASPETRPAVIDPRVLEIWREVHSTGKCRHPIHVVAWKVDTETGELTTTDLRLACKDRRAILCPSCAATYKADAWFLVTAGLVGGKGMPDSVAEHPRLFLTLTAPSFGQVHTAAGDGSCHPRPARACAHGRPMTCAVRHTQADDALGSPMCEECFDWEEAVLWNASASRLWNRTVSRIRRLLATDQHLSLAALSHEARVEYLRVAEIQRRGLVHFHAVLRCDGPDPASRPPPWLTTEVLARAVRRAVATTRVWLTEETSAEWGSQLELVDLGDTPGDAAKVAGYVAKYATKATDGEFGLARRFRDVRDVTHTRTSPHFQRLAAAAWALGRLPEYEALRLREHAHTLGFTGQLLTKSRGFSTTFGALRAVRAAYTSEEHGPAPVDATYGYAGRGYSDPRAETLTEWLIECHAEDRKARRLRRLEHEADPESRPPTVV